jgi:hypothetical protein
MGRVVWNHSTHVEGLIPILEQLVEDSEITTITPGRINQTRSRGGAFRFRVTVQTKTGHKCVARKGGAAQEVFVVTGLPKEALQSRIDALVG